MITDMDDSLAMPDMDDPSLDRPDHRPGCARVAIVSQLHGVKTLTLGVKILTVIVKKLTRQNTDAK